jgi:hypothetical protein
MVVDVLLNSFLWAASCSGCFDPGERGPGINWTVDWVAPRAGLYVLETRKKALVPIGNRFMVSRHTSFWFYCPYSVSDQTNFAYTIGFFRTHLHWVQYCRGSTKVSENAEKHCPPQTQQFLISITRALLLAYTSIQYLINTAYLIHNRP